MNSYWFPRPKKSDNLSVPGGAEGRFSSDELFAFLTDDNSEEWSDRVGISSPADGSAKASTRLLLSRGWVFKTDLALLNLDKDKVEAKVLELTKLAGKVPLWHPSKFWFILETRVGWLPISACPCLTTLRQISGIDGKTEAWTKMVLFAINISKKFGIGLDVNPSNFGFKPSEGMYYLDDEIYPPSTVEDMAEALVSRIPESHEFNLYHWFKWGYGLANVIRELYPRNVILLELTDGVRNYPLPETFHEKREAFISGLRKPVPKTETQRTQPRMTCVLSDVHGNLPALDAVLEAAKEWNVDSFLFLGDVVGYGPYPRACIQRLTELPNAQFIKGNHDHIVSTGELDLSNNPLARETHEWTINRLNEEEKKWLGSLGDEIMEKNWLAVHGAPIDSQKFYAYVYELTYKENLKYLEDHKIQVCFYGHTHVPFIYQQEVDGSITKNEPKPITLFQAGARQMINPGSVGQPRDRDPRTSFAIWDRKTNGVTFQRISYPLEQTISQLKKEGFPADLIFRLEEGY